MEQSVKISWGNKVNLSFLYAVTSMCARFNWNAEQISHIMACMAFESGETFSPSIKNAAGSGATGLIQFMPATAKGLGVSTEVLSHMTAIEQLEYVEKYFKPYYARIHTLSDMYMAILMPKYIGKAEYTPIFKNTVQMTAYRQNAGLDIDKDGVVTKAEATKKVMSKLNKGLQEGYFGNITLNIAG